jgi:hypothetical protein
MPRDGVDYALLLFIGAILAVAFFAMVSRHPAQAIVGGAATHSTAQEVLAL